MFASNAKQQEKETLLFLSGLGLSVSVPILVSRLVELVKIATESDRKRGAHNSDFPYVA